MSVKQAEIPSRHALRSLRNLFARGLGISAERKEEIYIELSRSATLRGGSYWLQVLFSAGIATLGLVLNSPAVIIGSTPIYGNWKHRTIIKQVSYKIKRWKAEVEAEPNDEFSGAPVLKG